MIVVVGRILALLAIAIGASMLPSATASAQGSLQVSLIENPFTCDAIVRPLGSVSGLIPGESVEFSSPQLNGVFSRRVADGNGQVEMRWNCSGPQTWTVSVRGLSSGASASFTLTGIAAPPPPDAPIGAAFDAKSAMTAAEMAIWKDYSPFNAVGVYIDVNSSWDNRADKIQANLTPGWVSEVFADGWRIIPIYVGFQAPDRCATARYEGLSADPGTARAQGLAAAQDAVASVGRLGIGPGNPIYYDMEAYRTGCADAVLAFLDAWTEGVHAAGYMSGVYGSRSSTMWDLSRAYGTAGFDPPDAVWVSTGNGQATSLGLEIPSDGLWANARMHQYRLNITRSYGGVTQQIDENIVNAPLAGPGGGSVPTSPGGGGGGSGGPVDSDGDGFAEPEPDNCDSIANPDQADADGDGDGDLCDRDIDGDGVDNVMDFAPTDPTISAAPTPTAAPTVLPTPVPTPAISDTDGDGVPDPEPDNCDLIANPDQADLDGDGDGDVCDIDVDGDGVPDEADQAPRDPNVGALPTPAPLEDSLPDELPTPAPTPPTDATATPDAQVIVLPTPGPTATAPPTAPTSAPTPASTPTPTPTATVEPAGAGGEGVDPLVDGSAIVNDARPPGSAEAAADTVTILIDDESSLLPYGLVALGLFSVFCLSMGIRSYRRTRGVWIA